jgi:hypothetical protein
MPALTDANNATNIFLNQSWSDREVQMYDGEYPRTHVSGLPFCVPPQSRSEHLHGRRGSCDEYATRLKTTPSGCDAAAAECMKTGVFVGPGSGIRWPVAKN